MSRTLSHQWSDRKPFTRRVRWYAANLSEEGRNQNIRLQFEDGTGKYSKTYGDDTDTAKQDYNAFKSGTLTVEILFKERGPAQGGDKA